MGHHQPGILIEARADNESEGLDISDIFVRADAHCRTRCPRSYVRRNWHCICRRRYAITGRRGYTSGRPRHLRRHCACERAANRDEQRRIHFQMPHPFRVHEILCDGSQRWLRASNCIGNCPSEWELYNSSQESQHRRSHQTRKRCVLRRDALARKKRSLRELLVRLSVPARL